MSILKTEPVRLYSIAVAAVALAAYFTPTDAWPLVLALVAAVLGTGQFTRSQVFSQDTHERTLWHGQVFSNKPDQGAADFVGVLVAIALIVAIAAGLRYLGVW